MGIKHRLILILFLFSLYACASPQFSKSNINISKDFDMSQSEMIEKIPIRAGLFLSPSLRNFTYSGPTLPPPGGIYQTSFSLGDALCNGSERMLKNIFYDVIIIEQLETDVSKYNVDIIISPDLIGIYKLLFEENKKFKESPFVYGNCIMKLTMKWNVMSLDGKKIYVNTITGEDVPELSYAFTKSGIEETETKNMIRLINEHFQKAQDDLYSKNWWKKQWWKE